MLSSSLAKNELARVESTGQLHPLSDTTRDGRGRISPFFRDRLFLVVVGPNSAGFVDAERRLVVPARLRRNAILVAPVVEEVDTNTNVTSLSSHPLVRIQVADDVRARI